MTLSTTKAADFDPSFGENGRLEVRPPGNFTNILSNVTTDALGRLVIFGSYRRQTPATQRPGVARFTDIGAFDTGFGDMQDGLTSPPKEVLASSVSSIAMLEDGKFFITGASSTQLPLIQYDADGKLVSSQDIAQESQSVTPRLLALEDKFLVATANGSAGVIYRRQADGTPDMDFGSDGKTTFLSGNSYISTLHMARSKGNSYFYLAGEVGNDGFILRMTDSGELDQGFADNGVYLIKMVDSRLSACRKVIELSDGKLLALIASSGSVDNSAIYLTRLTTNGRIDTTFNRGEPVLIPGEVGEDLAIQDDKILILHRGLMTGNQLTRYLPNGALDQEFGSDGSGSINFNNAQIGFAKSITVQNDGKIVVAGLSGSLTVLLRLLP